jgi:hypothetical protein
MLLSLATSLLVLVSIPLLNVVDPHAPTIYAVLPTSERTRRDSNVLHRTKSNGSKYGSSSVPRPEPSKYCVSFPIVNPTPPCQLPTLKLVDNDEQDGDSDETSSLLSVPGDIVDPDDDAASLKSHRSHCLDVTGLSLLYKIEFWQLWIIMGLLTGVGLMTIKWVSPSLISRRVGY